MHTLNKIMAEQPLLRESTRENFVEYVGVVDPLTVIGTFTCEVHIHIRNR